MTGQRYLLDANMASYIIRGGNDRLASRLSVIPIARLCLSVITQGELLYGVARKPGATSLETVVRAFLSRVDILAWDGAAAERYGALRAALEAKGTPLGSLDTLIAAHALAVDAILVTNDHGFKLVPSLAVEDWSAP